MLKIMLILLLMGVCGISLDAVAGNYNSASVVPRNDLKNNENLKVRR